MPRPITFRIYRGDQLVRTEQQARAIIKIGRLPSAHLVLDDERVSRVHSVIELAPDGAISIIDMGSAEGTFVNGRRVGRAVIQPGDQIGLGGMRLVLEVPAADVASPPPPAALQPTVNRDAAALAPPPASGRRAAARRRVALRPADRTIEDLTHAADVGVELRLLWGDTLLDAQTVVRPSAPVRVGRSASCAIRVEGLPRADLAVVRWQGGDYHFAVGEGMAGVVEEKGARTAFRELARSRKVMTDSAAPGAFWIPIPRGGAVRAELGAHLAIEAAPWWERISYQFLNLFLLFFFLGAAFVISASNFPYETNVRADDLFKTAPPVWYHPPPVAAKPVPSHDGGQGLAVGSAQVPEPAEPAPRHEGKEGKSGRRDAPETGGRSASRAIDPRARDVNRLGVLAALGPRAGGLRAVFDRGNFGNELRDAVGNLQGPAVADSRGLEGLGVRGDGPGGGGYSPNTVGIGDIATHGRTSDEPEYGPGSGPGRSTSAHIGKAPSGVLGQDRVLCCTIDKDLVRAAIQQHAAQIRYCYEQQLALNPRLQGKVAIRWIIDADGNASDAQVVPDSTTLDDATVHACMIAHIQSWAFPKPKAGGQVIVTYPWILRAGGNGVE